MCTQYTLHTTRYTEKKEQQKECLKHQQQTDDAWIMRLFNLLLYRKSFDLLLLYISTLFIKGSFSKRACKAPIR